MKNNLFPIAKEGWGLIASTAFVTLFFSFLDFDFFAFISFVIFIFTIFVFRNPERELPRFEKGSFLSPVDGVVRSIEELENSEYAYRVKIESSYLNVSILRAAANAKLMESTVVKGTRLPSSSKLYGDTNEHAQLSFVDEAGNMFEIEHRLKMSFFPLLLDLLPSAQLMQSARYGVMLNGITTLYLPSNFRLNVNVADDLKASESLVGYFS